VFALKRQHVHLPQAVSQASLWLTAAMLLLVDDQQAEIP